MLALLLTSLAAVSTFIGGWSAIRPRRWTHLLLGFGAGALLGATFFDLLPDFSCSPRRESSCPMPTGDLRALR
jgi:hypothetical protein